MWVADAVQFNHEKIGGATVVAMPVNEREELLMWYLTPSPKVDRAISEHQWAKRTIFFSSEPWAESRQNPDRRTKQDAVPDRRKYGAD